MGSHNNNYNDTDTTVDIGVTVLPTGKCYYNVGVLLFDGVDILDFTSLMEILGHVCITRTLTTRTVCATFPPSLENPGYAFRVLRIRVHLA